MLFLSVQTQWSYGGFGTIPNGLNYAGVEAAIRLMKWPEEKLAEDFAKVKILENAFIAGMIEKSERSNG